MSAGPILAFWLSTQGHWFGGDVGQIALCRTAAGEPADAVLTWELTLGATRIVGGHVALPSGQDPCTVTITPPTVRVRVTMDWVYRLVGRANDEVLASGRIPIHIYPRYDYRPLAAALARQAIVVWDKAGSMSRLLEQARIAHRRVDQPAALQFERADIILVASDQLERSPFAQTALVAQAQAGAGVLVLAQSKPAMLAGYHLGTRAAPDRLEWRAEHPLLWAFRADDLDTWFTGRAADVRAIELPADEPALEVAYWPREVPGDQPVPIDALLVVRAVGSGRIVLCQLPLGDWTADPRSQRFLINALRYLSTRPGPTPRPSRRRIVRLPQPESIPTITIPAGGTP
jgi:hypothetical protein